MTEEKRERWIAKDRWMRFGYEYEEGGGRILFIGRCLLLQRETSVLGRIQSAIRDGIGGYGSAERIYDALTRACSKHVAVFETNTVWV